MVPVRDAIDAPDRPTATIAVDAGDPVVPIVSPGVRRKVTTIRGGALGPTA